MTSSKSDFLVSKENDVPLYQQIKESLRKEILERRLKEKEKIPSERSLCERFGVSRITVRQALSELLAEGLIERRQGKGTFVAPRKVQQGLARIVDFARTVLDLGLKPSTRITEYKIVPADVVLSRILAIPVSSQVSKLVLLGLGDSEPLVLYTSYFPLSLGAQMFEAAKERTKRGLPFSTYDLYKDIRIVMPSQVDQTFEATVADNEISSILKIKKGSPILLVTSIFISSEKSPLEFRRAMYRGDRYKFHITRVFA
jgi:GntR family transcriptional regulator